MYKLVTVLLLASFVPAEAQQTLYWKKDHIYDTSGRELAIATPLPSDLTAPTPPSSLTYSQVNRQSARLDWVASTDVGGSGLAGYKIYRGPIPVGTVGPTVLTFTDDSLQPGTTYIYTVVAFDNAQNHSIASNSTPSPQPRVQPQMTSIGLMDRSVRTGKSRELDR